MEYIIKPLEDIPELSEKYSRLPAIDGEVCMRKMCKKDI